MLTNAHSALKWGPSSVVECLDKHGTIWGTKKLCYFLHRQLHREDTGGIILNVFLLHSGWLLEGFNVTTTVTFDLYLSMAASKISADRVCMSCLLVASVFECIFPKKNFSAPMFQVRVLSQRASERTLRRKLLQQVVANISASHAAVASALRSSMIFLFNLHVNTFILFSLSCFLIIIVNFLPSPRRGIWISVGFTRLGKKNKKRKKSNECILWMLPGEISL